MEENKTLFATKKSLGGGQTTFFNLQSKMRILTTIPLFINEITKQVNENNLISLKLLTQIFQKHGIILDSKEIEVISRRFISPNGQIQALKLLKALDIGIPSDYSEIDKFQDLLPQPYRMISKILELEIIDRAWLEILRKYPEVQEEIPGRNMIMRRNKNLDIECFPSNQSEKSQNITAIVGCEHLILTINDSGTFSVLELDGGKSLHTVHVFHEESQQESQSQQQQPQQEYLQYLMTSPSFTLTPLGNCRIAVIKMKQIPKPPPEPEVEESEKDKKAKAAAAAAASKKAPPPAKGKVAVTTPEIEPPKKPIPTHRCTIALIDLLNIYTSSMQCNLVYSYDFNLLSNDIHCEFSGDGRCLTLSHGPEIAYFKFPPVNSSEELFGLNLGKIIEGDTDSIEEGIENKSPSKSENKVMEPQSQWNIPEEIFKQSSNIEKTQLTALSKSSSSSSSSTSENNLDNQTNSRINVKSSHFFSFGSDFNWEDQPTSTVGVVNNYSKMTSFRKNTSLYHNGLIVFLEEFHRWFIFGLRTAPPPPPPPAPISPRAETKNNKGGPAAAAAAAPPQQPPPESIPDDPSKRIWVIDLLRQFPLSSSVTTIEFDTKRSLLVIGQSDGLITLWDIKAMMLISIPSRHRSAVTSLCLTKGVSSHFLISGDMDGVLCFHKINVAASLTSDLLISANDTAARNPILTAELIDFRLDFTRESIIRIWSINGGVSIIVVQISSGRLVAYDADGAELLGRLSLTSGILGLKMEYSLALSSDCIISNVSSTTIDSSAPVNSNSATNTIDPNSNSASTSNSASSPQNPLIEIKKSRTQLWNERTAIASGCSNGFCAYFFRTNMKSVISSFNLSKFLSFYYPGITSLSSSSVTVKGKTLTPLALYKLLQPSQRMDSKIKSSQISILKTDDSSVNENKTISEKFSRTSSRTTGLTTAGSSSKLTTEKLKELEKSYQVLDSSPILLPNLGEFTSSRLTTPKNEFERSVKSSQNERINRKMNVLNSFKQLSSLM